MAVFTNILFWLGIAGLVDGSLGLLYEYKWRELAGGWNIRKIAVFELCAAWIFLLLHYVLRFCF